MAIEADEPAAMGDLNLAAVAARPTCSDHPAVASGDDGAAPARADVEPGVKAGEVKDRVIAIPEIGSDVPVDRHHEPAAACFRPLGIGGIDPFAAAVGGPSDQLEAGLPDPPQSRVKKLPVAAE